MSLIHYYNQPVLREPIVLVAFGGWNDAAEAATTAIKFLIDRWKPIKIAEIDAEDFFVFTETRPTVKSADGIERTMIWPTSQFSAYIALESNRDVILFTGVEPQLKWKTFSATFLEVCRHFNASEVVFLGALLADIPHSVEVPISGNSSDKDVMERLHEMDVHSSRYDGPTGIVGVLHDLCRRTQLSSATLWAAAPHYLAATPNIKVTAALLTYLNTYLSFGLDLSDIQSDASRFEEQITKLVKGDPEASAYVRKLEEQLAEQPEEEDEVSEEEANSSNPDAIVGTGPLPSADTLIRDVEELLRQERKNGSSNQDDEDNE